MISDHSQDRPRLVYTHFKSCDQSLDKVSFDFSNIFHAIQSSAMDARIGIVPKLPIQSSAMNAKINIIPKLPMGMVT